MARDIATIEVYVTSRRERKKIEMLFAHLKRILKLVRGPKGARDKVHPAATAQNLRKLAKLMRCRTPGRHEEAHLAHPFAIGRPSARLDADFFNKIRQLLTFWRFPVRATA